MTDSITIALSKGRILDETLPLLKEAGIELVDDVKKSRKLVFPTTDPAVRVLIIRATDVPTYVEYGGADLGVTGKDVLMEHGGDGLYEPLDLNISRCRLMTAGPKGETPPAGRIRVATKFVNLARRYYAAKPPADIIKLYGAMELAPILGLADEIVDIVDTGNTLGQWPGAPGSDREHQLTVGGEPGFDENEARQVESNHRADGCGG